jgi:hypothetical protein
MARSYTLTKTKTKRRTGQVSSHGDNQSFSVNSIGKKWLTRFEQMMWRKVVSPQVKFENGSSTSSSTTGSQAVAEYRFLPKNYLTVMETAANGGFVTDAPVKFFLRSAKSVVRMRNASNSNCKITLYDIVTKRAPPSAALDSVLEAWTKGLVDYGNSATAYQTVGQTPHKSPEFNYYFSINRSTTVSLEPGQQHDHTVYHSYNRIVDSVSFQNSASTSIPGVTRTTLIVFHGTLGHESLTPANVTYMPIKLDLAYTYEYKYGWIEKTARTYGISDTNPKVIADFDFMGQSGDVDTNAVDA